MSAFIFFVLALVSLNSGTTEAKHFSNAYIQNVKSGRCVTISKDQLLAPLSASKCNCDVFQFWKMEDGEHVISETAKHGYMDELWGKPNNGETVGIYDLTGLPWQKWRINQNDDGSYAFVVQHTSKCLHQGSGGTIDQTSCDDDDKSQQWKIIENPCGKLQKIPSGRFQLQNPKTGMCAVVLDDSDAWWAKVGTHKCSCKNEYHYWKLNKKTLVSEGRSKQCLANWEALGHPGVTQCICADDPIHRWTFSPLEDGNFNLITTVDGKCVHIDGESSNKQLQFGQCDRSDPEQEWRFYDACHPEPPPSPPPTPSPPPPPPQPTNVIPTELIYFFDSGELNWLNPTRYTLLMGGRWDSVRMSWITPDGRKIQPNTEEWKIYFGSAQPSFLNVLFAGGKSFSQVFGWMNMDFFTTWTSWQSTSLPSSPEPQIQKDVIPSYLAPLFTSGVLNWLNPTRYTLLVGGHWEPTTLTWMTVDGRPIRPNTEEWRIYFGSASPSTLNALFPGGQTWNDVFGWMTTNFFNTWVSPSSTQTQKDGIPSHLVMYFTNGLMNWLTPEKYTLLVGGRWEPTTSTWFTLDGRPIKPNTEEWRIYFGSASPSLLNVLFPGGKSWDDVFGWMSSSFFQQWNGWQNGGSTTITMITLPNGETREATAQEIRLLQAGQNPFGGNTWVNGGVIHSGNGGGSVSKTLITLPNGETREATDEEIRLLQAGQNPFGGNTWLSGTTTTIINGNTGEEVEEPEAEDVPF